MLGLWLALTISAAPGNFEPAGEGELDLSAERLLHDGQRLISTGEGNATLHMPGVALNADRIVYDQGRRVATATGNVVARIHQGGMVGVISDVLTIRFDDHDEVTDVYLLDGKALSKKDVAVERFLAADTADALERAGTTQALLEGNHLVRHGDRWTFETLEMVPCDCDFKNPSWSISASSATVDTAADRVELVNSGVWINHVPLIGRLPVLWLPWLSLPLTDRQSGLLFPRPDFSVLNGFALEQPVFVTLGRSADVTLTPGFYTGGTGPNGVAGPRLRSEFRYAASERASGRVVLGLLYDFRPKRDVETAARQVGTQRGWRGELSWQHLQDLDHGFGTRVEFNGHSDGDYNRDLTVDVIASSATYLRSSATAFHRGDHHFLGLDVGLRQDIQWGYDWLGQGTLLQPGRVVGPWGPGTLQRLPALTFGWSPDAVGPLRFSLEAQGERLSPLFSNTGDEGSAALEGKLEAISFKDSVSRLYAPSSAWVSQGHPLVTPSGTYVTSGIGNRVWELGEREARDRVMLAPRVALTLTPFDAVTLNASAMWRQLAWAGEASGRSWTRGYLVVGGVLETQLSRSFLERSLRHVLEPRLEVRAVPFGFQCTAGLPCDTSGASDLGLVPYDQLDFAVPDVRPRLQSQLELRQRLLARDGSEVLRLEVGQGAELATDRTFASALGETYGRLNARVGWLAASGAVRVDPLGQRLASDGKTQVVTGLTRLAARLDLDDGRGDGAYGAYENLVMEGTARSRQPLDLLFLLDRGSTSNTRVQQVTFGGRWQAGTVSLRYDALIAEQSFPVEGQTTSVSRLAFSQHSLALGWTPACDCMRIDLAATQPVPWKAGKPTFLFPSIGFNVSIARFGSLR